MDRPPPPPRRRAVRVCACFAFVQLLQLFWLWTRDVDASAAFLYGNVFYVVLSLVAKSLLIASYVTFVELSPVA